jgi:hypothetical protein
LFESQRAHSPLPRLQKLYGGQVAAGLASKKNKYIIGIEDSSQLAARNFNFKTKNPVLFAQGFLQ